MKTFAKRATAGVVVGGLVAVALYADDQPHAEFVAVAPNVNVNANIVASGGISNSTAQIETFHPAVLNLEELLPHDRLVVQTSELIPLTENVDRFNIVNPRTGLDPFFQRRQQPSRLKVAAPKLPPFWCNSFQKFCGRRG
ncbi:MAG: hypothetical protein ABSG40_07515 [Terriglobales bacterium]|jgi:hypothetical protein